MFHKRIKIAEIKRLNEVTIQKITHNNFQVSFYK